jgi:NitT/TauT family transport system permease protein
MRFPARSLIFGAISFLVLAVVWQLLGSLGLVDTFLISSPGDVVSAIVDQFESGVMLRNLRASIVELAVGFGISTVLGVGLGIVMGWYRRVNDAFDPLVWLGYSAPLVALYPVFLQIFGLGTSTVIAITVLLAVFPILINTRSGVENVDRRLLQAARSFGASDRQLFSKVVLPASMPLTMAGLRLGIGRAMVGVVVGEFFVGNVGLGYAISYYGGLLRTTDMLAAVFVIAVLGVALTSLLGLAERRIDAWRVEAT